MSQYLQEFANKHRIVLQKEGEVGFGRPCVGLTHGDGCIDFNPYSHSDCDPIEGLQDDRLWAPDGVDSYYKHQCLAVLVEDDNYDEGLKQLETWIRHLEDQGEVEIVSYETGATGIQAMLSGVTRKAIKFK